MRLSKFPHVTVQIACPRCARKGQYRFARLADRYESEIEMAMLLSHLAGDCTFRDIRCISAEFCGAYFPDMSGALPPDRPTGTMRPRIVGAAPL